MRVLPHYWWLPFALFIAYAPFSAWLDLKIAWAFFEPDGFIHQTESDEWWYAILYRYGELPGQIVGIGAALLLGLSVFTNQLVPWRKGALVVAITAFVGAALIINLVIKEVWGRPRPKQLTEFGGTEHFRPFYRPILHPTGEQMKSFPSGHAAMGFLFLSIGVVGFYERRRFLYFLGITVGWVWGLLLGYGRLAQGGHFLSDILASAVIMWGVALVAAVYAYRKRRSLS